MVTIRKTHLFHDRLFETHPECKDVFFLFRDIDDLQQLRLSKELQSHGLRVMSFIEKSVARLEQEDKLEQLAFELGRSHCRYNAPPKYYEYVGVQFIAVVKPILKENWTPEVEEAWKVGRSSARQGPSVPFDW
ncbi:cytoglobin-1-like isoform X3 [Scyliorhinus canicula]|uniref:cytoglobin-1-like isoform X3 n=1 Tax=Scyliorhinus canicula TaxID=7830 RepID=UPI0018F5382E|nr:cytoglobin-1-like isoform X3 [Scyliorhinus canicula]